MYEWEISERNDVTLERQHTTTMPFSIFPFQSMKRTTTIPKPSSLAIKSNQIKSNRIKSNRQTTLTSHFFEFDFLSFDSLFGHYEEILVLGIGISHLLHLRRYLAAVRSRSCCCCCCVVVAAVVVVVVASSFRTGRIRILVMFR
jgi:hypothetical protein